MLKISISYKYMRSLFLVHIILIFQVLEGQQINRSFDGSSSYQLIGLGLCAAGWGVARASQLFFAVTENKCGVQPCEAWSMGTIFGLGIAAICGWRYHHNRLPGNRNMQVLLALNHHANQPNGAPDLQALLAKKKAKAPLPALPYRKRSIQADKELA